MTLPHLIAATAFQVTSGQFWQPSFRREQDNQPHIPCWIKHLPRTNHTEKIVGAGQYSYVRCRSLHGYIQNVEASASNHFARPRKPAIGRKTNKKIWNCTEQYQAAKRKRLNKSNPIKRRDKRPPSLQELRHLWSVYMFVRLLTGLLFPQQQFVGQL